jgi:hypothetical protein
MKKTIIILLLIALFLACGYFLYTKFDDIKQRYLASRVNQLLAEMPTATPLAKNEEATPTSSVSSAIATAAALATAQAEEAKDAEAATAEPTNAHRHPYRRASAFDTHHRFHRPGIYLGSADWTDLMDAPKNWPVGSDDYSSAYFENGYYRGETSRGGCGWVASGFYRSDQEWVYRDHFHHLDLYSRMGVTTGSCSITLVPEAKTRLFVRGHLLWALGFPALVG